MNPVIEVLLNRKSIREYDDRPVSPDIKAQILNATLRAPTAGNMMLYSIIDVTDQSVKDTLAQTCDNQPFIATAPLVLCFVADYQRWYDYFIQSDVEAVARQRGETLRQPAEGDLLLACCDALIAAHTAVIAGEALGLGSCYIGDILENYEAHRQLLGLPDYAIPIGLVCFGYPTPQQQARPLTPRFDQRYVVFDNRYHRLDPAEFAAMYAERQAPLLKRAKLPDDLRNFGQLMYYRKFAATYSEEMSRSVRAMLRAWQHGTAPGE